MRLHLPSRPKPNGRPAGTCCAFPAVRNGVVNDGALIQAKLIVWMQMEPTPLAHRCTFQHANVTGLSIAHYGHRQAK